MRHDLFRFVGRDIGILHEDAAIDRAKIDSGARLRRRIHQPNQPKILFLLQESASFGFKLRCDNHLRKNFADRFGQRLINWPIANYDSAERRLLVGRERFLPRRPKIGIGTDAARVRVLQYRDRRLCKLRNETGRRANVENVVKR